MKIDEPKQNIKGKAFKYETKFVNMQQSNWPNVHKVLGTSDTRHLHFSVKNSVLVSLDRALSITRYGKDLKTKHDQLVRKFKEKNDLCTILNSQLLDQTLVIGDYQRRLAKVQAQMTQTTDGAEKTTTARNEVQVSLAHDIERKLNYLKSDQNRVNNSTADDESEKIESLRIKIQKLQQNLQMKNKEILTLRSRIDDYEFNQIGNAEQNQDRLAAKDACIQWHQLRANIEKKSNEEKLLKNTRHIAELENELSKSRDIAAQLEKRCEDLLIKLQN